MTPPTPETIQRALRGFIAQWFRGGLEEGLEPETPLVTSGIVDSAGVLELVDFIERQFGVVLTDADISLRNCNTLAALTELVAARAG